MNVTNEQAAQIRRIAADYSSHAAEQAEWFLEAVRAGDPDADQYGGNPDLVAALGHQTAQEFLGL